MLLGRNNKGKFTAFSVMVVSFLFLGSFMIIGKGIGRPIAEYNSELVERFGGSYGVPSSEEVHSETETDDGDNNIIDIQNEGISPFSLFGIILLSFIGLCILLIAVIFMRFRREIFGNLSA
jgi:hypothetical protein